MRVTMLPNSAGEEELTGPGCQVDQSRRDSILMPATIFSYRQDSSTALGSNNMAFDLHGKLFAGKGLCPVS